MEAITPIPICPAKKSENARRKKTECGGSPNLTQLRAGTDGRRGNPRRNPSPDGRTRPTGGGGVLHRALSRARARGIRVATELERRPLRREPASCFSSVQRAVEKFTGTSCFPKFSKIPRVKIVFKVVKISELTGTSQNFPQKNSC